METTRPLMFPLQRETPFTVTHPWADRPTLDGILGACSQGLKLIFLPEPSRKIKKHSVKFSERTNKQKQIL